MQRHQRDTPLVTHVLVVGGEQRRFSQEARHRRRVAVTGGRHFGPVGRAGEQFADVLPALRALGAFFEKVRFERRLPQDLLEQNSRRGIGSHGAKPRDQCVKPAQRTAHVGPELGDPVRAARSAQQRALPGCGRFGQDGEARRTQPAAGRVDRAKERFVVGRVGHQPEVGQHVPHLAPVVEADGANQAIRHSRAPERFLKGA